MSDQPSLLDWTPAHQRHSPTSKAAAEAIKHRVGPMHGKILTLLRHRRSFADHGAVLADRWTAGATDEEMQFELDMAQNTQRPRRRELQQWGLVIDSGTTRATKSGRQAVVWVLAENRK